MNPRHPVVDAGGPQHRKERELRMRKTNNLPWMGRTVVVAIMALVGLGVFAGSAEAQTTVYDYDDYMAWWDSFNCAEMKVLLPMLTASSDRVTADETTAQHEARVCRHYMGSGPDPEAEDTIILRDFIEGTEHSMKATHKAWWDANSAADNACSYQQQALAGQVAISGDDGGLTISITGGTSVPVASTTGSDGDYCGSYDRLRSGATMERVMKSGDALSGRAMMTDGGDDMDTAPALPLVGVGLLGLLLAGRGAWLRRRA